MAEGVHFIAAPVLSTQYPSGLGQAMAMAVSTISLAPDPEGVEGSFKFGLVVGVLGEDGLSGSLEVSSSVAGREEVMAE